MREQGRLPLWSDDRHETVFEWRYVFHLRDCAFFIRPDVWFILDPGGTRQIPDALVVGSQVGFNF